MKQFYIFFWTVSLSVCGVAQTVFSLDECLVLAKAHNRQMEAARLQIESAVYDQRSAYANFFPTFALTGTGLYSTIGGTLDIGGGLLPVLGADGVPTGSSAYFPGVSLSYRTGWLYGAGITFRQPLFMGGSIHTGYRMAGVGKELARQNRRLTESEVVIATARAYADVVRATAMGKVAVSYNTLLKELMRSVEKAYSRGVKSRNDVLKVEVKLDESELDLHRAKHVRQLALMNLCHCIGYPLDEEIEVDSLLPLADILPEFPVDIVTRPEVQMLSQKNELMRLKVKMARAEMLPQVGLAGQYGLLRGFRLGGNYLPDDWNFIVGIQVSVPLSLWGSHAKVRSAQIRYEQTLAESADKKDLMTLEATRASCNLDEAALGLALAEKNVASAVENLRVSRHQYSAGAEPLSNYLEAQTLWQQAKQSLVDARIHRFLCWIEYRKAIGMME